MNTNKALKSLQGPSSPLTGETNSGSHSIKLIELKFLSENNNRCFNIKFKFQENYHNCIAKFFLEIVKPF